MNQKDLTHNVPLQYTGIINCMVFSDTVEVCQILITVFPHTLFSVLWASARVNRYFFSQYMLYTQTLSVYEFKSINNSVCK